ncbi:hypothetical protein NZNM25_01600 [Nitrosopumilus zosterae]|uniref:Uncharacterized protein n=1 Tax=Nitrosopumilus zosterae TaxID=718286 RepID=A0A2S2KP04_9ARCH|nr:hypothetical protein [Nitrosopumilus zosterae]BDQ31156.1 hypothetical protein NZOSNM25_001267 [Nitrosopumilus zosterae]GBH33369.1 hypothetical protein NZNM25_01600 [Nitrosopumilus zosterae]
MTDYRAIFVAIAMLVVFFVFVVPLLLESVSNMNNQEMVENLEDKLIEYCGLSNKVSKIYEVLESLNLDTLDERTKQIYWDLGNGNEVSKCDMLYFYQQLNEDNKKKLNWFEFACNVNDCLKK